MPYDLVVHGAVLVNAGERIHGTLAVRDGVIRGIFHPDEEVEAHETVDGRGLWILPGAVDLPLDGPGDDDGDHISAATAEVATGGVTTVVLWPGEAPPDRAIETLIACARRLREHSHVDFALLGGVDGESLEQIVQQADAGAVGFAGHMTPGQKLGRGEGCVGSAGAFRIMERVAQTGRFITFRCVDAGLVDLFTRRMREMEGAEGGESATTRPEFTEVLPLLTLLELAEVTGAQLHLADLSSARAVSLADVWRGDGTPVTVGTRPHYVLFSSEDTVNLSAAEMATPPLRSEACRCDLWDLLLQGGVDMVATGTRSAEPQGIEASLPLLLNEAVAGELSPEDLVRMTAEVPARLTGLYPQKGSLQVGADADLLLFNPEGETEIDLGPVSTTGVCQAEGRNSLHLAGHIEQVYGRGRLLADNGEARPASGSAEWLRPPAGG